ncbi:MAG: ATP-binding protein [Candidatus Sumerlaeaceae bacterium]|nr:ATP-binding protein [Candidatus Sumerlaeaceae bacterium]
MMAYLYPSKELNIGEKPFELKGRVVTIGRHPNNDISLLLESVSRFHAKLELVGSHWLVTDLNSSNGTFVNGERIASPQVLSEGDVLTLGQADLIFSFLSPEERARQAREATTPTPLTSSGVNLLPEGESASTILTTQRSVEATPLPARFLPEVGVDIAALRKANARLLALYELNEIIRTSSTTQELLERSMDLVFECLPADRGVIMTVDAPGGALQPQVVRFRNPSSSGELAISKTIVDKAVREQVAILSRDASIDSRFKGSESIIAHDIRSTMCVPMVSKQNVHGIIFLDCKESVHSFTEDDLAFLASLANDLAISIENASLLRESIKNERLAAVGQTIAGLAHNIKNILQLARGGIELLDAAVANKSFDDIETFWPIVKRGIERMQQLTQEMLDYSRQTKPELVEASVNEVVLDTVRLFEKDAVEAHVEIELQLADNIPPRRIDPNGLCKSLMNLLTNAVDAFEGTGGRIVISTSFENDTVYLRVSDNGKGIPPDKFPRIFQPFFTTKGSKGTGLGLSMTKKYIEDMGGKIDVQSQVGQGTTFTISLPPPTKELSFDVGEKTTRRDTPPTK